MQSHDDALALSQWQTRFLVRETERAYRVWRVTASIPFIRVGLFLSVALWTMVVPLFFVTHAPNAVGATLLVIFGVMSSSRTSS